jgi:hypothetical protein
VTRFAEAQGGWARVESRDNGGSSFKVFLPDGAGTERPDRASGDRASDTTADELHIVVAGVGTSSSDDGSALVEELHRLSAAED